MELTNVTKISEKTIETGLQKAKTEKAVIERKANEIRDGADLRRELAIGVDNKIIDELSQTRRGGEVLDDYLKLKNHLSKQAYDSSDGLYNEVLPNGDRRKKLSEVNPITGECTIMTERRMGKIFAVPKLPWKN